MIAAGAAGSRSVLVLPPRCGGSGLLESPCVPLLPVPPSRAGKGPGLGDVILQQFLALVVSYVEASLDCINKTLSLKRKKGMQSESFCVVAPLSTEP